MGTTASKLQEPIPADPVALGELVNRLAHELAEARRTLNGVQQRLGTASRALEGRTQELAEARAALSLLLATLDSTTEGVLALGHFGRAMHYNARFIEMWRIPEEKLAHLNEPALLAMQMTQVKDPAAFLGLMERAKSDPESDHLGLVTLTDGRVYECQVLPQRLRGKRVGCVTSFRDVTDRERLGRLVSALEAELPEEVAEAKATTW
jgi:PAS domain-containing protein